MVQRSVRGELHPPRPAHMPLANESPQSCGRQCFQPKGRPVFWIATAWLWTEWAPGPHPASGWGLGSGDRMSDLRLVVVPGKQRLGKESGDPKSDIVPFCCSKIP